MPEFRGFGLFFRVVFQIAVQARASNPQNLRRSQPISLAHIENAMDVYPAHPLQRQGTKLVALRRAWPAVLQAFRQVRQVDEIPTGGNASAGDYVFQFAYVTRP